MSAPTRRGILSALAIAPVVIAAPALAVPTDWQSAERAWVAAHATVRRYNQIGVPDEVMDAACEAEGRALDRLIATPAPHGAAIGTKITAMLAYYEASTKPEDVLQAIAADAARLS